LATECAEDTEKKNQKLKIKEQNYNAKIKMENQRDRMGKKK